MNQDILIVAGLPRSGSSMLMAMLEAGGVPILQDGIRKPDIDNPKGYYEFERVKKLPKDTEWVKDARGKAVKVLGELICHMPISPLYKYKVIYIERDLDEMIASQNKMIKRLKGKGDTSDPKQLKEIFLRMAMKMKAWIGAHDIECVIVSYHELLNTPCSSAMKINRFLGGKLNEDAMSTVADKSLYRNRKGEQ